MGAQFRAYLTQNRGIACYLVRYKAKDEKWRSLAAPRALHTLAEVEAWAPVAIAEAETKRAVNSMFVAQLPPSTQAVIRGELHTLAELDALDRQAGKPSLRQQSATYRSLTPGWLEYRATDPNVDNWKSILHTWVEEQPIGNKPITSLTMGDYTEWKDSILSAGRASYTMRNIWKAARKLFDDARKKGWIPEQTYDYFRDALLKPTQLGKKHGKKNIQLTGEQRLALTQVPDERRRVAYTFALLTGMRRGEMAGLTWEHVDLQAGKVSVKQQLRRRKKERGGNQLVAPKTEKSDREIPLHPLVIAALQQLPRIKGEPFVFGTVFGRFIHASNYVQKDLKAAGLPTTVRVKLLQVNLTFHTLRHSFADSLRKVGAPDSVRKALIGHAPGDTEGEHYSDVPWEEKVLWVGKLAV